MQVNIELHFCNDWVMAEYYWTHAMRVIHIEKPLCRLSGGVPLRTISAIFLLSKVHFSLLLTNPTSFHQLQ